MNQTQTITLIAVILAAIAVYFFGPGKSWYKKDKAYLISLVAFIFLGTFFLVIFMLSDAGTTFLAFLIVLLLGIILGTSGRIFCMIPQNYVGAVYRGGIRRKYVVSNEEDFKKLTEERFDEDGKVIPNAGASKVEYTFSVPLITDMTNVSIFSFNPFDSFKQVEVTKNRWKTKEQMDEEKKLDPKIEFSVKDTVSFASPTLERFLRIQSTVVGYDGGVELQGNIKTNYTRQTNVSVWNLDEIYLNQNGRYSAYMDETLRAAHISLLNTLPYNTESVKNDPVMKKKLEDGDITTFQEMDFSENPKNDFNRGIQKRIQGTFGSIVISSTITQWDLSLESKTIVDQINEATASEHRRKTKENDAIGDAAIIKEQGLAKAAGEQAVLKTLAEVAGSKNGAEALEAWKLDKSTANLASGTATRVINMSGQTSGVLPTIPLEPGVIPVPKPKKDDKTEPTK